MKEISLGVGFLKLQAVQHGAERLRREPDVRCDRQFCSWWRLKKCSQRIGYVAEKGDNTSPDTRIDGEVLLKR